MADISQITLPSGTTYNIKDTAARTAISSGGTFVIAWAGNATPVVGNIPKGVVVKHNSTNYTGTKEATADDLKKFYLVAAPAQGDNQETLDIYDEYVVIDNGASANSRYTWEKIGDTQIKLTAVLTDVELDKKTANVIGADSTFTITQPVFKVTPSSTYVKATTSKETVLKGVTKSRSKLQTGTVIGVKSNTTTASKATAATSQTTVKGLKASTSNSDLLANCSVSGEVLTIGAKQLDTQTTTQFTFNDVTVPIKNDSASTFANGSLVAESTTTNVGDIVVADISTPNTDKISMVSGVELATDSTSGDGKVQVATSTQVTASQTTNVGVAWNSKDQKTVLTSSTGLTKSRPN